MSKALIVCASIAMMFVSAARAQTNTAADSALAQIRQEAQANASAAKITAANLTPIQHEEAQQFFSTAFGLAQQQDYDSAKVGFQRGLAIDPSNGQAEYFLAEVLVQLNDLKAALPHYALASVLTPSSVEGLKAEAALVKGQMALLPPLQVGDVWHISAPALNARYVFHITERVSDSRFKVAVEGMTVAGTRSNFDALASVNADTMTITAFDVRWSNKVVTKKIYFSLAKAGPARWIEADETRDKANENRNWVMTKD